MVGQVSMIEETFRVDPRIIEYLKIVKPEMGVGEVEGSQRVPLSKNNNC